MENFVNISNELLLDFIKIRENYLSSLINLSNKVINDFTKTHSTLKKENEEKSIFFNPLNYFNIGETLHSYMLADLLNPNSNHGQGPLFLHAFLEELQIDKPQSGYWKITAEIGRIDILLVRDNPLSVIIIENKSNNAKDQDYQLYRYWYQEIYLKTKDPKFKLKETYYNLEVKNNYKIIYLTPNNYKEPSIISLKKPHWDSFKNFDVDELPMPYEIKTFDKFICPWLNRVLLSEKLNKNNFRLREYLNQYIELWK